MAPTGHVLREREQPAGSLLSVEARQVKKARGVDTLDGLSATALPQLPIFGLPPRGIGTADDALTAISGLAFQARAPPAIA